MTEIYNLVTELTNKENIMAISENKPGEQSLALKILLACGATGPLLFIFVFLIEGATRPGYSAWHNMVSSLSDGPGGWMQRANFIVCGALVFAFAFGLKRALRSGKGSTWGPILLDAFGLCLVGAGIFVTDPLLGYPPGVPTPTTPSVHGALHVLLSLIVFASLIAACFVLARRFAGDPAWRGWTAYSIITGTVVLVFFIATDVVSTPSPSAPAGLLQRISIITGWVWVALFALRLMRQAPPTAR
jgi:hypothetical membrane protein